MGLAVSVEVTVTDLETVAKEEALGVKLPELLVLLDGDVVTLEDADGVTAAVPVTVGETVAVPVPVGVMEIELVAVLVMEELEVGKGDGLCELALEGVTEAEPVDVRLGVGVAVDEMLGAAVELGVLLGVMDDVGVALAREEGSVMGKPTSSSAPWKEWRHVRSAWREYTEPVELVKPTHAELQPPIKSEMLRPPGRGSTALRRERGRAPDTASIVTAMDAPIVSVAGAYAKVKYHRPPSCRRSSPVRSTALRRGLLVPLIESPRMGRLPAEETSAMLLLNVSRTTAREG